MSTVSPRKSSGDGSDEGSRDTGQDRLREDRSERSGQLPVNGPTDGECCDHCDHCGSTALVWRQCKLVCANCRQIMKSCADL